MKLGFSKSVMLANFSQNTYQMKLFPKNVFSTLIVNFLQINDKKSNLKKKLENLMNSVFEKKTLSSS